MALELPPESVDTSRLGVLTIEPQCFAGLLGLDRRHRIISWRERITGVIEFTIAGEDMPEAPSGIPVPVKLIVYTKHDNGTPLPLELCWEHKPEKRWTLP